MRKLRRLVTSFLSVALIAAIITIPVHAADLEVSTINDLKNAVTSATDGSVITLAPDFSDFGTIDLTLPLNASITIDGSNVDLQSSSLRISGSNTKTTTLKNFVFNSGNGKAIYVNTASSVVLDNFKVSNRTDGGHGGAMSFAGNANIVISNSSFVSNTQNGGGYSGGAIGVNDFYGKLTIQNTYFYGNKTTALGSVFGGEGGAISILRMYSGAELNIIDSYFDSNTAVKDASGSQAKLADGGAISIFDCIAGVKINIDGTTFANNVAGDDGGAILIQTNDSIATGIEIKNSTFFNNLAQAGDTTVDNGGAIQFYANGSGSTSRVSTVIFENNTFVSNTATRNGGAIAFSRAGIFNRVSGVFNNNLFVANNSANNSVVSSNTAISNTNNVGYSTKLPLGDVFGEYGAELQTTFSSVMVGHSSHQMKLPSVIISPVGVDSTGAYIDGKANDVIDVITHPEYLIHTFDQIHDPRSSKTQDAGAVEIGYVLFDANGGVFASEAAQTSYNGTEYKIKDADDAITMVYKISYLTGDVSVPSNPSQSDKVFKGWSETSTGAVLTSAEVTAIITGIEEAKTLYAIYEDDVQTSKVVIVYEDEQGGSIPGYGPQEIIDEVGQPYDTTSYKETITGYSFKEVVGDETGVLTENVITVKYIYTRNQGTVVINYKDDHGNSITDYPSVSLTGNTDDAYDTTSYKATIPGYEFKEVTGNETGVYADDPITVTYVYTRLEGTVIVNYVDVDGNPISGQSSLTVGGYVGQSYDVSIYKRDITGYTFVRTEGNATGTFTAGTYVVNYVYDKAPVVPKSGTVTVYYVDQDGKAIADSVVINGTVGDQYSTVQKTITGYVFDRVEGVASGVISEGETVVRYIYTKTLSPELPSTGTVNHAAYYALGMIAIGVFICVLANLKNRDDEYLLTSGFRKVTRFFKK